MTVLIYVDRSNQVGDPKVNFLALMATALGLAGAFWWRAKGGRTNHVDRALDFA
jgi:hypothetical protein